MREEFKIERQFICIEFHGLTVPTGEPYFWNYKISAESNIKTNLTVES